eukprot:2438271-Pyramimonas_sp.AAC.1
METAGGSGFRCVPDHRVVLGPRVDGTVPRVSLRVFPPPPHSSHHHGRHTIILATANATHVGLPPRSAHP